MVGLFHVNSAAFPFLELLPGHQKCPNFPKIFRGARGSSPGPLIPQSTKQNNSTDMHVTSFAGFQMIRVLNAQLFLYPSREYPTIITMLSNENAFHDAS